MVGLVVLSLLIVAVGALMTNVTSMQRKAIELTELNTLVDNVSNPIIKDLSNIASGSPVLFCDAACTCNGACPVGCASPCPCNCAFWGNGVNRVTIRVSGVGAITYSVDADGVLFKSCNSTECPIVNCAGHAVYQKDYYKSRSINFALEDAPGTGTAYVLTVTLTDDRRGGDELLSRSFASRPLSLNQYP
jgi:hypothetical protein